MIAALTLVAVTRAETRVFVQAHHSHHHKPNTYIAAVGVASDGRLACVAILELPKARMLCNGRTAEVSRVASDGTAKHAASMAGGAITRAALALGYARLISYTLLGEAGTMYRALGWWPTALCDGGSWDRPSRPRDERDSPQRGTKVRWEYGPEAMPRDAGVDALVREWAGRIELPRRDDTLPLWRKVRGDR